MKHYLLTGLGVASLCTGLFMTSCIDKDYDLSDMDSNVEVKFNDLVLPLNVEPVTLDDVISVESGDKIQIVNGKYAVLVNDITTNGDNHFESAEIEVKKFHASTPHLTPYQMNFEAPAGLQAEFSLPQVHEGFTYMAPDVDHSIISVKHVGTSQFRIGVSFTFAGYSGSVPVTIKNIRLKLPEGLDAVAPAGRYDKATKTLEVTEVRGYTNDPIDVYVNVTGIDMTPTNHFIDPNSRNFHYSDEINIENADVIVDNATAGNKQLTVNYILDDFTVESFSGSMKYFVEDFDIPTIDLGELPTFLSQDGTNLMLKNPQIYLSINNPLKQYDEIYTQTGFQMSAIRESGVTGPFGTDEPIKVETGLPVNANGGYDFCLSPVTPVEYLQGFSNCKWVKFSKLPDVIAGNGLPKSIEVKADTPFMAGDVENFELRSYGKIEGKYAVYAPLDLEANSSIVYTKSNDGWSSEDLDNLVIEKMELTVNVTSDINAEMKLDGYPLDINGNRIDAKVTGAVIPAKAQGEAVTLLIEGKVTGLDGFFYEVSAVTPGEAELTPDKKITLSDVRIKATGSYLTDF